MNSGFVGGNVAQWNPCVRSMFHDFYHLREYVVLCAKQSGGVADAFVADIEFSQFFLPIIVRAIEVADEVVPRSFDAITPYGYSGPILYSNKTNTDFWKSFHVLASAFVSNLQEKGIVSALIRTHPLIDLPWELANLPGRLVQHGQTVVIDLSASQEELWRQTRSGHRSEINRARKNGYVAEIDEAWEALDEFCEMYTATMKRVQATSTYFFSREYFQQLHEALGDQMHLCIVRIDGEPACGGLFSEVCGIVQYHLSGTSEKFARAYPTKLMIDFIRTWAQERGNRYFHLGGGLGAARDSLFEFKAGFSKLRRPFYTWRIIADPVAYRELTRMWEKRTGLTAESDEGYFPAYRKAIPVDPRVRQ